MKTRKPKAKNRTELIQIRTTPQFKQDILKYCYEKNLNITDVLEMSFAYYKAQHPLESEVEE